MKCTALLSSDHRTILRALDLLRPIALRVNSNGPDAAADARILLDFFREFADTCHHSKEEMLLFPRLKEAGMRAEGGPLAVLLLEHDQGRTLLRMMGKALEGRKSSDFAIYADRYARLLADHIEKEDRVLFARADSILTENDDEQLVNAFDTIEQRMGDEVHEKFHRVLLSLESKYLSLGLSRAS